MVQGLFWKHFIVFGVIYHSPSSNIDQLLALTTFMHERFLSTSNLICLGDFNTPNILWPSLSLTGYDVEICKVLLDFSLYFCLKQIVETNTRGDAVLDLVFIRPFLLDHGYECEVADGISDHKAVLVSISVPVHTNHFVYPTFPDFYRANDASVFDLLSDSFDDFKCLSECNDVNSLVASFGKTVATCIKRFVLIKKKKKTPPSLDIA